MSALKLVTLIAEAKARLPLPELMAQLGLGDRVKKSTHCPFHDDRRQSFSVWNNDHWNWKCHAGCGGGDEITFLEVYEKLSRKDAVRRFLDLAGVNGFGKKNFFSIGHEPHATPPSANATARNGMPTRCPQS
jgi:DNA primase